MNMFQKAYEEYKEELNQIVSKAFELVKSTRKKQDEKAIRELRNKINDL